MKTKALLTVIVFSLVFITAQAQAAGFRGLGGDHSIAKGVSADGAVVVGFSDMVPFRWTLYGGMEELDLGHFSYMGGATAISGDGEVAVGGISGPGGSEVAVRWISPLEMESLPRLPGGDSSSAFGVNLDGSVIVGHSDSTVTEHEQAFLWTVADGTIGLGTLAGHYKSRASSVSSDGRVVAGTSCSRTAGQMAFRWTAGGGMTGLGYLPGYDVSEASDVSADGKTIVGACFSDKAEEAFRWRKGDRRYPFIIETMEGLGDLKGGDVASRAYGVSGDGEIVVGVGSTDSGDEAAIWIGDKIYNLKTYLIKKFRLPIKDWTLTAATDISTDGKTIVGYGINPDGETEAWIASISKFPHLLAPTDLRIVPRP